MTAKTWGPKETRDDKATVAAREIIDAEKEKQAKKTARLREARLAKEAADLLAHAQGKPRANALKAKEK